MGLGSQDNKIKESEFVIMLASWTFGSLGSGFYATVTFDGNKFSVNCVEGAFDLNALWFSDGDSSSGEGQITLPQGSSSLSMHGTKERWDDYVQFSSPGLKKGQTLGSKSTYFTAGETKTYSLIQLQNWGLDSSWISDWSTITLGIRATSVSGVAGSTSIKYVSTPDLIAPTVTAGQSFSYAENRNADAIIGTVAATDNVAVTGFRFSNPGGTAGTTSTDGYYTIDSSGVIRITAAGVAAGVAQNDFETTPNAFTYAIEARDAAGNWSASAEIALNVTDERPLVVAGQSFGYTENRHQNSFIGSVDASDETRVTGFGFWDSEKESAHEISPDGLFRIDTSGRIWLTAAGAASFANNFEDTEADGSAVNIHTYSVVAVNGNGTWSLPTTVTLNETNCKCDDAGLDYLIDLTSSGEIEKTLLGSSIYDIKYDFSDDFPNGATPSGAVEAAKELIRIVANDPSSDPNASLNIVSFGETNPFGDVACVNVQADGRAESTFEIRHKRVGGQVVNSDRFMSSLEKIYLGNPAGGGEYAGSSCVKIDSDGGYNVMPSLKDITLKCLGNDSARLNIYGDVDSIEEYVYEPEYSVSRYHPDAQAGDDFMVSLETIHLSSQANFGASVANIRSLGGDNYMRSLGSIDIQANGRAELNLEAYRTRQRDNDGQYIGFNGNNDNFMSALEVINLKSNGSTTSSNLKLKIEAKESDNFLSSLSLIDTNWLNEGAFRFYNLGGSSFMGALQTISTGAAPNGRTDFQAINERYVDDLGVGHEASDFMTSLETISILNTRQIFDFEIRNGDYDYSSDVGSMVKGGANFLPSLRSIELDASTGICSNEFGAGSVDFKLLVDQQDAATLSSLESLIIKGGEIRAEFAGLTGNEAWFDLDKITGIADGQQDDFFFEKFRADSIVVRAGFDTESIEDRIVFASYTGITSLSDLVITALGTDNVRIGFTSSLGYDGAVIVTGVPNFDPNVNIGFV